MATLLQHPCHEKHPLKLRDFSNDSKPGICDLCDRKIWADGYACKECFYYIHRVCAEAPPRIDPHPLHTDHPLTLIHRPPPYLCDACGRHFPSIVTSFRCDDCDFNLDVRCALSTLSDRGGTQGKTPEQIKLPLHIHPLTSFSTRHDFIGDSNCVICKASVEGDGDGYACLTGPCEFIIHKRCVQDLFGDEYDINLDISCTSSTLLDRGCSEGKTPKWIALPLHHHLLTSFSTRNDVIGDSNCVICKASVEGDGYACLHWGCEFLIHMRCIQDLYYTDGTKAPQIFHGHPLETFLGDDKGSSRCGNCGSDKSREFIGCAECQVFYCRDCIQVPAILQCSHHPDHTLVLLISSLDNDRSQCDSCLVYLEGELCYGCPSCEFFVHLRCALQVLAYCEEGMSTKIKLSWHKHQLHLCHGIGYELCNCSYCEDKIAGPMYVCKAKGCKIRLHKRCIEIEVPVILQHPHHHPDHPLTLCQRDDFRRCEACFETILHLYFSCKPCEFYLHAKCASRFPTRKHPLHEHELLHLDKARFWICNRCGTRTSSPFFRCVPCDLNLHEKCMELPQVVKSEIHWHELTLHETYIEDDSGEYYCDKCEKIRDVRLGAYVCLQCSARWAYHIECVFPELRKVCVKDNAIAIERLTDEIETEEEEVLAMERKLDEMKRKLEEKRKKRAALIIIE